MRIRDSVESSMFSYRFFAFYFFSALFFMPCTGNNIFDFLASHVHRRRHHHDCDKHPSSVDLSQHQYALHPRAEGHKNAQEKHFDLGAYAEEFNFTIQQGR